MTHASRRYDLDWIRVLAFGLLILYHIGIGFVPWDVYAYENNDKSESLELVLLFIGQWRLPVLFLVSGMSTGAAAMMLSLVSRPSTMALSDTIATPIPVPQSTIPNASGWSAM